MGGCLGERQSVHAERGGRPGLPARRFHRVGARQAIPYRHLDASEPIHHHHGRLEAALPAILQSGPGQGQGGLRSHHLERHEGLVGVRGNDRGGGGEHQGTEQLLHLTDLGRD